MSAHGETIYLDYAATAGKRPPQVADAVAHYLREIGATPGRGGHRLAVEAGRTALRCRLALRNLLRIPGDPGRIAFMLNATHALNTALSGVLRSGDVVVRTVFDHNAVRRPLNRLARERGVTVRIVPGDASGAVDLAAAERLLADARLLVINAASNVLGTPLPVRELGILAKRAGALVLVDAAQAAGHLPFDVGSMPIDLLAFTGHKGLLGPQGTGGLWVRDGVELEPLLLGGSGGDSLTPEMPEAYPDHLEAGTQNAPGIAGLLAGIEWLAVRDVAQLHEHTSALKLRLREGLAALEGVRVLGPPAPDGPAVVTIVDRRLDAAALATRLDREHGVLARAGLHCAPDTHKLLGTDRSGALRLSLGWATTAEEVEHAVRAVAVCTGPQPRTVAPSARRRHALRKHAS
ncbi:MAG: aminotransferase class V-fold PLP-dependent enzyme [Longimicrobiales bacterium]